MPLVVDQREIIKLNRNSTMLYNIFNSITKYAKHFTNYKLALFLPLLSYNQISWVASVLVHRWISLSGDCFTSQSSKHRAQSSYGSVASLPVYVEFPNSE